MGEDEHTYYHQIIHPLHAPLQGYYNAVLLELSAHSEIRLIDATVSTVLLEVLYYYLKTCILLFAIVKNFVPVIAK